MSNPTVEKLRTLLSKATAAPWTVTHNPLNEETRVYAGDAERAFLDGRVLRGERHDGDLIAALRNAAPSLLDAFERLVEESKYWRKIAVEDCDGIPEDAPVAATDAALEKLSQAGGGEAIPDQDAPQENVPIGTCRKCGTLIYIELGYCGGCQP